MTFLVMASTIDNVSKLAGILSMDIGYSAMENMLGFNSFLLQFVARPFCWQSARLISSSDPLQFLQMRRLKWLMCRMSFLLLVPQKCRMGWLQCAVKPA